MKAGHILIIDDEEKLRSLLARITGLEGFEVKEAADAAAALKKLEQYEADAVLCDVKLPDANGVELVAQIKAKYPFTEVILLTAFGNIADGVKSIRNGAYDYIVKGDDNEKIIPLLHRAVEKSRLQRRVHELESRATGKYSFEKIIGNAPKIHEAVALAKKVATTDATVLLLGETGTGKEVFAQAIHNGSARSTKAFVAINCSAFGKELLESEIFGHKAGAFTGAVKDKKGLFEEAGGGTIFLDEVGDMHPELQAKFLRVLETGEFIKVGDTKAVKVNVRVIAATNRNLLQESEAGHFRSDLYYRLSVFQLTLPALRERPQDIGLLAQHFAGVVSAKLNRRTVQLTAAYIEKLQAHAWKGNIRELKNVVERSVILSEGDALTPDLLPPDVQQTSAQATHNVFDLAEVEKIHIRKVLAHTGGNKTETARLLNIGLTTLYRKIEEYKL